jgi:peroxiredoxin Q/BCP
MSPARSDLKVAIGDPIPSVGLRASDGFLLNLRSFVGKRPVGILFFAGPTVRGKAGERGVALARALADGHERLTEAGIEVVGVTTDSEEQQAEFIKEHSLPYLLFSDERRTAVEILGIKLSARGENYNVATPLLFAVAADGRLKAVLHEPDPASIVDQLVQALSEPVTALTAGA